MKFLSTVFTIFILIISFLLIFSKFHLTGNYKINDIPDKWEILPFQIIGKVHFSLPYIGYVINFVKTPLGFLIVILIPIIVIIFDRIKNEMKSNQ